MQPLNRFGQSIFSCEAANFSRQTGEIKNKNRVVTRIRHIEVKSVLWLKGLKHKLSAISLLPLTNEKCGAQTEIYIYTKRVRKFENKKKCEKS